MISIIGGAGFIGTPFCRRLEKAGQDSRDNYAVCQAGRRRHTVLGVMGAASTQRAQQVRTWFEGQFLDALSEQS